MNRSMVLPARVAGAVSSVASSIHCVARAGAVCALLVATIPAAHAFCGFYVGKADSTLFNDASQVILVRDGDKTVISMLNDYRGDLKEFAIVVPVPQVLERGQINVGERKIFDRLDAYSAPRLAEYHDGDPCMRRKMMEMARAGSMAMPAPASARDNAKALGVTVEASYTVGEYDIVILSATQSDGLEKWLTQNGYKIPRGASAALRPYIRQDMKFFVARVNLKEQAKTGSTFLRPLQFAFDSQKFMLPIRLGMINATGPQDLILYVMTKNGRVETTNYRTVKIASNVDVPTYVKGDFARFYKAMFTEQAKREEHRVAFTEYFWDMSWCDPCAADPLSKDELRASGVFWVDDTGDSPPIAGAPVPIGGGPAVAAPAPMPQVSRIRAMPSGAQPVMLTRLHIRYSRETFPEDLVFQQTQDKQNFQARYVLHQPWKGDAGACDEAREYLQQLPARFEREAQTLASLTGWDINEIRRNASLQPPIATTPKWWNNLWKRDPAKSGS